MAICSHTLVKNGQPFIDQVLRNVEPYMDRMLITVSTKSNDGTKEKLWKLESEFPEKVELDIEYVHHPGELTQERQKQLNRTENGSWVLFLDDDDWWPEESLQKMRELTETDVDGYAFNPYQLIDESHYDSSWWNKHFTKLFRKTPTVHYRNPWPRDLIYKGDEILYWKKNVRVPKAPLRFFHLSYLKSHSFRNEDWAKEFAFSDQNKADLPPHTLEETKKIYAIYTNHRNT